MLQEIDLNDYPILFQDANHGKDRYLHVQTINPCRVLQEAGWKPREVIQMNPRKEANKGFQKHRVRFFNENLPQVNKSHVELLLTNSYDAKTAFQIELGVFRTVCANGLVVGDTYGKESVRHLGYSDQKIYDSVEAIIPESEKIVTAIEDFSDIKLSQAEINVYGKAILDMRLDTENDDTWVVDDFAVSRLNRPMRYDDTNKTDLWTTFNRAQENLCRSGFKMYRKDENGYTKVQKVQALKNTFRSDPLNKALWTLTEEMAKLKQ